MFQSAFTFKQIKEVASSDGSFTEIKQKLHVAAAFIIHNVKDAVEPSDFVLKKKRKEASEEIEDMIRSAEIIHAQNFNHGSITLKINNRINQIDYLL